MQKILEELSLELHLSKDVIYEIYKSYWKFIKETILNIDFKNIKSIQDYNNTKVNFNIPNIGKLYCSFDRIKNIQIRKRYINETEHKENKANVQSDNHYNGKIQ